MSLTSLITMSLSSFPEELLERILTISSAYSQRSGARVSKLAPLLVSRQFYRISHPLLYHTISIQVSSLPSFPAASPETSGRLNKLLHTLLHHSCPRIHALQISGLGSSPASDARLIKLLQLCAPGLNSLDISFHQNAATWQSSTVPDTITQFCSALRQCTELEEMTLRKTNGVYMTLPFIRAFIYQLAGVVEVFGNLKSFYLAFRPSDEKDTSNIFSTSAASRPAGPLLALTTALAALPHLETFITHVPIVWNEVLLGLSGELPSISSEEVEDDDEVPAVGPRIILLPESASAIVGVSPFAPADSHGYRPSSTPFLRGLLSPSPRAGSENQPGSLSPPIGLFRSRARNYPRLWSMIQAGEEFMARLRDMDEPLHRSGLMADVSAAARGRSWTWAGDLSNTRKVGTK